MITGHTPDDLERRLAASLHRAAPHPAPDLADRLLRRTAVIEQHRGILGLGFVPALAAAAVVAVAVVIGLTIGSLLPRSQNVGPEPSVPVPSSSAPAASPSATPVATPSDAAMPPPSPGPLGDALECTNTDLGFSVRYPGDWWANEAQPVDEPGLDDIPACFAFAEEPVEIRPASELPAEVAIVISGADQILPPSTGATVVDEHETTIAGRPATVREDEEGEAGAPFSFPGQRRYSYFIELPDGTYLVAGTSSREADDPAYETHKAILDAMMESLELSGG